MTTHVVGCVPYVNARPLVRMFEKTQDVQVLYDVPAKLPALLDAASAEAILVSSFDALSVPDRTFAEGVCIGSDGPVESVKIFSKVPIPEIRVLARDPSSLTSNNLALAYLTEVYGFRKESARRFAPVDGSSDEIFGDADATILIGDRGMKQSEEGLHVLDLGDAWTSLTGLPFVWALWVGTKNSLKPELVWKLNEAARWGEKNSELIAAEASTATGLPLERCRRYLSQTMNYQLSDRHMQGLRAYRDLLLKHGLIELGDFPGAVTATSGVANAT